MTTENQPAAGAKVETENLAGGSADEKIHCPNCGSTQITANRRGFRLGSAALGGMLFGRVGALLGGLGGRNKIRITCLKCGHVFKPGEGR